MADRVEARAELKSDLALPHVGELFRRVRVVRGVRRSVLARRCGLAPSTVHRFEESGNCRPETLERMASVLAAPDTPQPLAPGHVALLRAALDDSLLATQREHEFRALTLAACVGNRPPGLERLIALLARQTGPAAVIDGLGFIHAANRGLFLMTRGRSEARGDWQAWNIMSLGLAAARDAPDAFRAAEQLPKWTLRFLLLSLRYQFTAQGRALVTRLLEEYGQAFHNAWHSATGFCLPYDAEPPTEVPVPQGDAIVYRSVFLEQTAFETATDGGAAYHLGAWQPLDDRGRRLLQALAAGSRAPEIVFAHDHDADGTIHVNAWPEVLRPVSRSPRPRPGTPPRR